MVSGRAFFGLSTLLFAVTAGVTIVWSAAMPAMPTCSGRSIAMAWMRMPGQGWPDAAASFLGMWMAMMAAMMLPSLAPLLWRYRQAVGRAGAMRPDGRTALAAAGYFFAWGMVGIAIFPLGAALAEAGTAPGPFLPVATGVLVALAGALQFTAWKGRHLACCRRGLSPADAGTAWRHGLRLARHCACSCAGPMAILLAIGVMDLGAMAAVTAAVTAERLAPAGLRVAHATGAVAVAAGLFLVAQAA